MIKDILSLVQQQQQTNVRFGAAMKAVFLY